MAELLMEEFLTTRELSDRIKMAPGTIRNLVWRNTFVENVHFVKPTPRKLLFVWSAMENWLRGDCNRHSVKEKSLINI